MGLGSIKNNSISAQKLYQPVGLDFSVAKGIYIVKCTM